MAPIIKAVQLPDKVTVEDVGIKVSLFGSKAYKDDIYKALLIDDIPERKPTTMNPEKNAWEVAEAVLSVSRRVLLRGKPGSGKTFTAVHSGLREDQKVYQVTMTPETPMAELRGHFIAKGGDFVWHDGVAMRAWREGARLVVNEIDRAGEDVLSFLYAVLDDPEFAETTLPTGEVVRPKEGFQVVATMNGEPDDLPDALQDRLPVDIHIQQLHPDALKKLPDDLQDAAMNTAVHDNPERAISVRAWLEFAHLREKLGPETAAQAVFGPKAGAALTALAVANEASPAISMEGETLDSTLLSNIKDYLKWAEEQHVTEGGLDFKYIYQTLNSCRSGNGLASSPTLEEVEAGIFYFDDANGKRWTAKDF